MILERRGRGSSRVESDEKRIEVKIQEDDVEWDVESLLWDRSEYSSVDDGEHRSQSVRADDVPQKFVDDRVCCGVIRLLRAAQVVYHCENLSQKASAKEREPDLQATVIMTSARAAATSQVTTPYVQVLNLSKSRTYRRSRGINFENKGSESSTNEKDFERCAKGESNLHRRHYHDDRWEQVLPSADEEKLVRVKCLNKESDYPSHKTLDCERPWRLDCREISQSVSAQRRFEEGIEEGRGERIEEGD